MTSKKGGPYLCDCGAERAPEKEACPRCREIDMRISRYAPSPLYAAPTPYPPAPFARFRGSLVRLVCIWCGHDWFLTAARAAALGTMYCGCGGWCYAEDSADFDGAGPAPAPPRSDTRVEEVRVWRPGRFKPSTRVVVTNMRVARGSYHE